MRPAYIITFATWGYSYAFSPPCASSANSSCVLTTRSSDSSSLRSGPRRVTRGSSSTSESRANWGASRWAWESTQFSYPPVPVDDSQISLHAFVINLYGLFDNLAWAFVWRHRLEKTIDRRQVGMFSEGTKRYLPHELRSYVNSPTMENWSTQYLKNYRDALAHRIPLYIPPASYSDADAERFEAINHEELECIRAHDWDRVNALRAEEHELGTACPMFVHSFSDSEGGRPVFLSPTDAC